MFNAVVALVVAFVFAAIGWQIPATPGAFETVTGAKLFCASAGFVIALVVCLAADFGAMCHDAISNVAKGGKR